MNKQFSILDKIQKDLKFYESSAKDSINSINKNIKDLPEKDKEIFVNLQNRLQTAIKNGETKDVYSVKDELINYLKSKNAWNYTSN